MDFLKDVFKDNEPITLVFICIIVVAVLTIVCIILTIIGINKSNQIKKIISLQKNNSSNIIKQSDYVNNFSNEPTEIFNENHIEDNKNEEVKDFENDLKVDDIFDTNSELNEDVKEEIKVEIDPNTFDNDLILENNENKLPEIVFEDDFNAPSTNEPPTSVKMEDDEDTTWATNKTIVSTSENFEMDKNTIQILNLLWQKIAKSNYDDAIKTALNVRPENLNLEAKKGFGELLSKKLNESVSTNNNENEMKIKHLISLMGM